MDSDVREKLLEEPVTHGRRRAIEERRLATAHLGATVTYAPHQGDRERARRQRQLAKQKLTGVIDDVSKPL